MRRALAAAAAVLGAAALPAAAAAKPSPFVSFKVTLSARQQTTWTQDVTIRDCGGVFRRQARGKSTVVLRSAAPQILTFWRAHGQGVGIGVAYAGAEPGLPVKGTLARHSTHSATVVHPPTPGACRPPEDVPRDCGTRRYPADSTLGIGIEPWRNTRARHAADFLYLTGPVSSRWVTGPDFRNCLSMGADHQLDLPSTYHTKAALLHEYLFGKRRHFVAEAEHVEKMDMMRGYNVPKMTGAMPLTVRTLWKLRFTRVRPRPPA